MEESPKLYTVAEVARILIVTQNSIYTWISQGIMGCYKIGNGRSIRIGQEHIDAYLNKTKEPK